MPSKLELFGLHREAFCRGQCIPSAHSERLQAHMYLIDVHSMKNVQDISQPIGGFFEGLANVAAMMSGNTMEASA